MLIYSMSVSVDGFIADRDGAFEWTAPSEELFRFHLTQARELAPRRRWPRRSLRRSTRPTRMRYRSWSRRRVR
jgi:hypothetical protein